jgi:hypothetical protein
MEITKQDAMETLELAFRLTSRAATSQDLLDAERYLRLGMEKCEAAGMTAEEAEAAKAQAGYAS